MPKALKGQDPKISKSSSTKTISKVKKGSKALKQKQIVKKVANSSAIHYILMLDDSGSMSGKPWQDLKNATKEFLEKLTKTKNPGDKISCVIYNSTAKVVFEEETPSSKLDSKIKMTSGGTRYAAALCHAKNISKKTHTKYTQLVYYFMSDGMPHDE